jgi:signal transduction histidine kinase
VRLLSSPYVAALGLAAVVAVLASLVSIAAPAGARYHEGIVTVWLGCLLLLLTGAVLLYGLSVVDRQPAAGWLAAAAVSTAVYTASFALRLYFAPHRPLPVADVVDLLMALVWLAMIVQATREHPVAPYPGAFLVGALTGAAGIGLQVLAHQVGQVANTETARHVVVVALVLVGSTTVAVLLRSHHFAEDVRTRLLIACALATASRAMTPDVPTTAEAWSVAAAVLGLLGTALFCREAAELLVRAREELAALARLRAAELVAHDQQEQLHEVRAGLAALGSAARLLARDDGALSDGRKHRLATLMEAEMDRLGRLVGEHAHRAEDEPDADLALEAVELDDVLETVVTGRRLCGQQVEWHRVGEVVVGSRDALVEALSILLVNASQHAPGAVVHVDGETVGDEVHIVVADEGPGIPAELRPHLFTRGAHGADSDGEGIGLSLAHRIITSLGGRLRLAEPGSAAGAAFEVALPVHRTEVVA